MYENFTSSEISAKVAQLVKPDCLNGTTEVEVVIKALKTSMRHCLTIQEIGTLPGIIPHLEDMRVVHKAFLNTKTKTAEATDLLS